MRLIVRHSWQQLPGRFWSKWEHTPIPHTHTHTLGGAFQKRYRYIASTLSLPGIVTNALNIISLYTWKHLSFLCITIFSGFVVCFLIRLYSMCTRMQLRMSVLLYKLTACTQMNAFESAKPHFSNGHYCTSYSKCELSYGMADSVAFNCCLV